MFAPHDADFPHISWRFQDTLCRSGDMIRFEPYPRPHFNFDIAAFDEDMPFPYLRSIGYGLPHDSHNKTNRLRAVPPPFAYNPNEHQGTAAPPPARPRNARPRRTAVEVPTEQQRTAWGNFIDGALADHVSFMMWPATDKASEVERCNVQGVNRLKKANFRMGLTPVFAGQVEPRYVHIFSVCVRELLSRLLGEPFTDDVFVTMVRKKVGPNNKHNNKFGATVWTSPAAARILRENPHCQHAIRVTPTGYYLATSEEERQRIKALDSNPCRKACRDLPAHSVIFTQSKLGVLNGN